MSEEAKNLVYEGDDDSQEQSLGFTDYDISAVPNDFNVRTLCDFIDSGMINIPGFQRNYVWDMKRASKFVESLLVGIPIPQMFLYEQSRNKFLVIDGQQRYFTIYFFRKKRFPRLEKSIELRNIFDENKKFPDDILADNDYFVDFNLSLPEMLPDKENRFNRLNYSTLSEQDRDLFDLRTIRNIIIKQLSPDDGDSVVFEIFSRLNSGGVNLKPQEIRTSMYHSNFYKMLERINLDENWRKLTPTTTPDLNMKDMEIILRGFAMLVNHDKYKPTLIKFLNAFSTQAKRFKDDDITYFESLFTKFALTAASIDSKLFFNKTRFNIAIYESIFVALTEGAYLNRSLNIKETTTQQVQALKNNSDFIQASQKSTASTNNVQLRINKAKELL
ncbi:MAG: DUF262 domain-containing protein [Planctomycetaceae bacterium]|jgi:hypothetical protein|nr:DUF262 domain-containing protein [Planctomycetaceae bacterium]